LLSTLSTKTSSLTMIHLCNCPNNFLRTLIHPYQFFFDQFIFRFFKFFSMKILKLYVFWGIRVKYNKSKLLRKSAELNQTTRIFQGAKPPKGDPTIDHVTREPEPPPPPLPVYPGGIIRSGGGWSRVPRERLGCLWRWVEMCCDGIIDCSQVTALGCLSSRLTTPWATSESWQRAVLNPGLPDFSFDGISIRPAICANSRVVKKRMLMPSCWTGECLGLVRGVTVESKKRK
jgi:hypothetical protein